MTTKTVKKTKKVVKKVTKANTKKVAKKVTKSTAAKVTKTPTTVTMTVNQAKNLQAFAAKNGKAFKFLDTKISAVNA